MPWCLLREGIKKRAYNGGISHLAGFLFFCVRGRPSSAVMIKYGRQRPQWKVNFELRFTWCWKEWITAWKSMQVRFYCSWIQFCKIFGLGDCSLYGGKCRVLGGFQVGRAQAMLSVFGKLDGGHCISYLKNIGTFIMKTSNNADKMCVIWIFCAHVENKKLTQRLLQLSWYF